MTDADLDQIESALGVTLPADYRRVMTDPAGAEADDFWHCHLYNRPERVVEETRWLRDMVVDGGGAWSPGHVAVTVVNGGDVVALDTTRPDAPLLMWNHETDRFETFMAREFMTVQGLKGSPPPSPVG